MGVSRSRERIPNSPFDHAAAAAQSIGRLLCALRGNAGLLCIAMGGRGHDGVDSSRIPSPLSPALFSPPSPRLTALKFRPSLWPPPAPYSPLSAEFFPSIGRAATLPTRRSLVRSLLSFTGPTGCSTSTSLTRLSNAATSPTTRVRTKAGGWWKGLGYSPPPFPFQTRGACLFGLAS